MLTSRTPRANKAVSVERRARLCQPLPERRFQDQLASTRESGAGGAGAARQGTPKRRPSRIPLCGRSGRSAGRGAADGAPRPRRSPLPHRCSTYNGKSGLPLYFMRMFFALFSSLSSRLFSSLLISQLYVRKQLYHIYCAPIQPLPPLHHLN